jgi:hypothetical protein
LHPGGEADRIEVFNRMLAQAIEQVIHRHYAHWRDETIPALGGLTPRQAITTPASLERALSHAPATRHLRRRPRRGSFCRGAFRPRSRRSGALIRC